MTNVIRYHISLTDDPGGFVAAELAAAIDGTVVSTVRRFDGTNDLALIDIDANEQSNFEATLDFEGQENGTVVAWHTSVLIA